MQRESVRNLRAAPSRGPGTWWDVHCAGTPHRSDGVGGVVQTMQADVLQQKAPDGAKVFRIPDGARTARIPDGPDSARCQNCHGPGHL